MESICEENINKLDKIRKRSACKIRELKLKIRKEYTYNSFYDSECDFHKNLSDKLRKSAAQRILNIISSTITMCNISPTKLLSLPDYNKKMYKCYEILYPDNSSDDLIYSFTKQKQEFYDNLDDIYKGCKNLIDINIHCCDIYYDFTDVKYIDIEHYAYCINNIDEYKDKCKDIDKKYEWVCTNCPCNREKYHECKKHICSFPSCTQRVCKKIFGCIQKPIIE